ncbi:hypothetical protein [Polaribacter sp.]|uniref:hypothetical protein n=1 Tax=Polaribacter sp. TaxID=1920175 RepID=UPI0025E6C839|nr:hypothetical protein [Polaribacter sp.]
MFKSFTADVGFSTAIFDTQKYTTFDAVLRYDFGTSMHNVVPYVVIGGSFVSALETTPTLNLGAGNTFWVKKNTELMCSFCTNIQKIDLRVNIHIFIHQFV